MKYLALLFLSVSVAYAQSFSPGIPLPGLPKSLGQKPMAGSTSVTIASNQTAIPITGTISASNPSVGSNGSGAPTSSTQIGFRDGSGNLQAFTGSASGVAITGTVTSNQGTSPWVSSIPSGVAITNTPTVVQGTSPWIASIPSGVAITNTPTVNQGTSPWVTSRNWTLSGLVDSVAITGTVTAISAPITATASAISRATNSASSQTLLSANGTRKGVFLYNDSTTNCYVKFGATASLTSFTMKLFSTDTYIMDPPTYTGIIDYICDAATGSMEVNEL